MSSEKRTTRKKRDYIWKRPISGGKKKRVLPPTVDKSKKGSRIGEECWKRRSLELHLDS